jgi:hypothetical protein
MVLPYLKGFLLIRCGLFYLSCGSIVYSVFVVIIFLDLSWFLTMSLKQAKKDNKLSPKYYGPYKVLQKIGTMAYTLEIPASSRVHPVFHVSCLKKVIGDKIPVQTILPELDEEGKIILDPEAITDTRIR